MIYVIKQNNLFLLFDDTRGANGATYRWASKSRTSAQAAMRRASCSSENDWLDAKTLAKALASVERSELKEQRKPKSPQAMEL